MTHNCFILQFIYFAIGIIFQQHKHSARALHICFSLSLRPISRSPIIIIIIIVIDFSTNSSISIDSTRPTTIATLRCAMGIRGANAKTLKSTTIGLGEWERRKAKHRIGPLAGEETLWIEAILNRNETIHVGVLVGNANEGDRAVLAPMRPATIFENTHLFNLLPNVLIQTWV